MRVKSRPGRIESPKRCEPRFDHRGTSDQDRQGEAFLGHDLGRPQYPLVLAFGIDDALGGGLRLGEQRLHDEAGAEHEFVEPLAIGLDVGDRPGRDAGGHGGLGQRRRDPQDQPGIERIGDQRARPEGRRLAAIGARRHLRGRLAGERRDGVDRRDLHGLVDLGGADIERAAEDIGKAQDVVHLVGEVRASGADQGVRTRLERLVRHDLRGRVGERHDQGPRRHPGRHLRLEHAGGGQAEKDIGAVDDVGELPLVGLLGVDALPAVHQHRAAFVDEAFDVGRPRCFGAARPARPGD